MKSHLGRLTAFETVVQQKQVTTGGISDGLVSARKYLKSEKNN